VTRDGMSTGEIWAATADTTLEIHDADPAAVDGVYLVEATWLQAHLPADAPALWFWECPTCQCAFGPLTLREHAEQQARQHAAEDHTPGFATD